MECECETCEGSENGKRNFSLLFSSEMTYKYNIIFISGSGCSGSHHIQNFYTYFIYVCQIGWSHWSSLCILMFFLIASLNLIRCSAGWMSVLYIYNIHINIRVYKHFSDQKNISPESSESESHTIIF